MYADPQDLPDACKGTEPPSSLRASGGFSLCRTLSSTREIERDMHAQPARSAAAARSPRSRMPFAAAPVGRWRPMPGWRGRVPGSKISACGGRPANVARERDRDAHMQPRVTPLRSPRFRHMRPCASPPPLAPASECRLRLSRLSASGRLPGCRGEPARISISLCDAGADVVRVRERTERDRCAARAPAVASCSSTRLHMDAH